MGRSKATNCKVCNKPISEERQAVHNKIRTCSDRCSRLNTKIMYRKWALIHRHPPKPTASDLNSH